MKQYSKSTILFVFLSTVIILSCQKEKEPLSSSTTGSGNSWYPSPPAASGIYSDLSPVNGAEVFYFSSQSVFPISCNSAYCTKRSRYILHNDGSFVLQYNHDEGNEYRRGIQYKGRYIQINNDISFTWEGASVAGPWGATGTLRGDTLTVGYNSIMSLTDFEDAVYQRKR